MIESNGVPGGKVLDARQQFFSTLRDSWKATSIVPAPDESLTESANVIEVDFAGKKRFGATSLIDNVPPSDDLPPVS
ncbi:MAG: hypothetical protein M3Q79_04230 [bacterium]|nr:hypothetical protein [bacterium]